MNNWENQLKEAFDMVRMEPELKQSVVANLTSKHQKSGFNTGFGWKKAAVLLCTLVLIMIGWGGHCFLKPVNIISIDINPSLELGINAFDRVVSVEAYNNDGEELKRNLSLQFLNSMDAVNTVLSCDLIQSCLSRQEELTLTVVGDDEAQTAALYQELENAVGNRDSVYCHSTSSQMVEDAHHSGLSYGKYLTYLQALEQNPELKPEDVQEMTMSQIKALSGDQCSHGHGHEENQETDAADTANTIDATDTTDTTLPLETVHHDHENRHNKKKHH